MQFFYNDIGILNFKIDLEFYVIKKIWFKKIMDKFFQVYLINNLMIIYLLIRIIKYYIKIVKI